MKEPKGMGRRGPRLFRAILTMAAALLVCLNAAAAWSHARAPSDVGVRPPAAASASSAGAYDDRDNLLTLTDPNGKVTRFEYDRSNRIKRLSTGRAI